MRSLKLLTYLSLIIWLVMHGHRIFSPRIRGQNFFTLPGDFLEKLKTLSLLHSYKRGAGNPLLYRQELQVAFKIYFCIYLTA